MGSSTLTFKDGKLRIKAIFNLFGKLTFYDCLFFSIKQFPSSIQEKFNTVEEIYEVLQKKYQVSWKEIQFSFQETKYSFLSINCLQLTLSLKKMKMKESLSRHKGQSKGSLSACYLKGTTPNHRDGPTSTINVHLSYYNKNWDPCDIWSESIEEDSTSKS